PRPTRQSGSRSRRRGRLAVLPMAALLALAPVACSSDDDVDALPAEEPTTASTAPAEDAHDDGHGGAQEYEVTLSDFSFAGLPKSVAAGSTLTVVNEAVSELHELVAFRLPDDETRSVDELLALPQAEVGALLGAPVM